MALDIAKKSVGSYPTFSPLLKKRFFSVALSLDLRQPFVKWNPRLNVARTFLLRFFVCKKHASNHLPHPRAQL